MGDGEKTLVGRLSGRVDSDSSSPLRRGSQRVDSTSPRRYVHYAGGEGAQTSENPRNPRLTGDGDKTRIERTPDRELELESKDVPCSPKDFGSKIFEAASTRQHNGVQGGTAIVVRSWNIQPEATIDDHVSHLHQGVVRGKSDPAIVSAKGDQPGTARARSDGFQGADSILTMGAERRRDARTSLSSPMHRAGSIGRSTRHI